MVLERVTCLSIIDAPSATEAIDCEIPFSCEENPTGIPYLSFRNGIVLKDDSSLQDDYVNAVTNKILMHEWEQSVK